MKHAFSSWGLVLTASAVLLGLLQVQVFRQLNQLLDKVFHGAPAWTSQARMHQDERRHELSSGERPRQSLNVLAEAWKARPELKRLIVVGNSQAQTISLSLDEYPPGQDERTYFDYLADTWSKPGREALLYRLSAGGLNYQEALWYTLYLVSHPEVKPDVIVLQVNYQSMSQGGLRNGVLELLDAPRFQEMVRQEVALSLPHADTFAAGLAAYGQRNEKKDGQALKLTPGERLEAKVRAQLNRVSWFAGRYQQKGHLMGFLYRCRLYLLRIRGTTARSISGPRLVRSQSAIEAIVRLCQQHHVRLVLVFSPMNPAVNLFRTEQDRQTYRGFFERLGRQEGVRLIDLENSIAGRYWGMYYNTPDPLHLGREGHRQVAKLLEPALAEELFGR